MQRPDPVNYADAVEVEDRRAEIMDSVVEAADVVVLAATQTSEKTAAYDNYDKVNAVTAEQSENELKTITEEKAVTELPGTIQMTGHNEENEQM